MGLLSSLSCADGRSLRLSGIIALLARILLNNIRYSVYLFECAVFYVTGQTSKGARNPFLSGSFGPVIETEEARLQVIGRLPKDLDGVFVRIGPNPAFTPAGDYHWFDGDGMVHAVRIKDGEASYANRFVKTSRLHQERAAGFPLFLKFGDAVGVVGLFTMLMDALKTKLGLLDKSEGAGTANTALVYHAKKLMALHEGDLPHAIQVLCSGVTETLGRVTLGGKWDIAFTAHPKLDPVTGELHFFGYQFSKRPYARYGRLSPEGKLLADVPIDIPGPVMMHDMGLAGDYVIFIDGCLAFDPQLMVKKGQLPFEFDKSRPARFGVLPKNATSAEGLRWFETSPMVTFHTANAWQEGSLLKLYLCVFGQEFSLQLDSNIDPVANAPRLTEFTLDLSSKEERPKAAVRRVSEASGDFPQVPWRKLGQRSKYAYLAHTDPLQSSTKMVGVVKLDLEAPGDGKVGVALHGPGVFGGEAFFVPAQGREGAAEDDDGYLAVMVHDESKGDGGSELRVYDAKTMSSEPVARVLLPQRVPHGFHCIHISEEQFQEQAAML
eukprot:jgi/Botrbrau1/2103/Bobra.0093s0011.1